MKPVGTKKMIPPTGGKTNIKDIKTRVLQGKPRQYPVWFTKACRSYLKRKGLDSRDSAGSVVYRALEHWQAGLSSVIDHYGMIKMGCDWNFYTQPYGHCSKLINSLKSFLMSLNIEVFECGQREGPHHPDTIYIEFGIIH
jgi:hypothetical protein